MKKQITKGKVIQSCMKVVAAVVVAGGVGFQFQEIQELNKDLAILNQENKVTVQTLQTVKSDNLNLKDEYASLSIGAEKLTAEVSKLKVYKTQLEDKKKALEKERATLVSKKKAQQAEIEKLTKELEEMRERARKLNTSSAEPTQKTSVSEAKASVQTVSNPIVQVASVSQDKKKQVNRQVVSGQATAYNANCKGCSGTTASGKKVGPGMVAMAKWVPLGTKVRITCPSYPSINGVYSVEDRGGAIKGNKVDVFVHTYDQAIAFGRRDIQIEILN